MTKPKNRKKTPKPHYRVHRRPRRRKSPEVTRAIPPPIAGGLTDIREKGYSEQSRSKLRDSITISTGAEQ
jgi:hypothetical protein